MFCVCYLLKIIVFLWIDGVNLVYFWHKNFRKKSFGEFQIFEQIKTFFFWKIIENSLQLRRNRFYCTLLKHRLRHQLRLYYLRTSLYGSRGHNHSHWLLAQSTVKYQLFSLINIINRFMVFNSAGDKSHTEIVFELWHLYHQLV